MVKWLVLPALAVACGGAAVGCGGQGSSSNGAASGTDSQKQVGAAGDGAPEFVIARPTADTVTDVRGAKERRDIPDDLLRDGGTAPVGGLRSLPAGVPASAPTAGGDAVVALPAVRSRVVDFRLDLLPVVAGASVKEPATIQRDLLMTLFEGHVEKVVLDRMATTEDGSHTWSGIAGESGSIVLVRDGEDLYGTIRDASGRVFDVRPADGGHVITEVDLSNVPPFGEPLHGALDPDTLPALVPRVLPPESALATVDVLVLVTPRAFESFVDAAHARKELELIELEANRAFELSKVHERVRLLGPVVVQHDETTWKTGPHASSANAYVAALKSLQRATDGVLDEVDDIRSDARADVVTLLIRSPELAGLADLIAEPTPEEASRAFSVVNVRWARTYLALIHELGHLHGCDHNHTQDDNPLVREYAYGYCACIAGGGIHTIMSAPCTSACRQVPLWSNPSVQHDGTQVGTGPPSPCDDHRAINETRLVVAAWSDTL